MRARDPHDLLLSPGTVTNPAFPYDGRIAAARQFLASRGITDIRPLYGARGMPMRSGARLTRVGTRLAATVAATRGWSRIPAPWGRCRAAHSRN